MQAEAFEEGPIVVREAIPSSDIIRRRFGEIDGLRALAILAVIAYEVLRQLPTGAIPVGSAFERLALDSSQGFTLVLILSGFSLAYSPIAAYREDGGSYLDVGRFLVKRFARIWPAYLVALLLTVALPPVGASYGMPGLGAMQTADFGTILRSIFFIGDGLGNDGFAAVALVERLYIAFPLLLFVWSRSKRAFAGVLGVAALLDAATPAHAIGLGAILPFGLGIVATDVRLASLPAWRFGVPLAIIAGTTAWFVGPLETLWPGTSAAPDALRIDPFWALALFGVFVAIGAVPTLCRILAFPPLRLLGVAGYAIGLDLVPIAAFTIRQTKLDAQVSPLYASIAALVVGMLLWQLVDRPFAEGALRRRIATALAPRINLALARLRLSRVVMGNPIEMPEIDADGVAHAFYAPPPRSTPSELAEVSHRTGSPEDLAAEIARTKRRLAERSAAFFSSNGKSQSAIVPPNYEKPGFYRRNILQSAQNGVPKRAALTSRVIRRSVGSGAASRVGRAMHEAPAMDRPEFVTRIGEPERKEVVPIQHAEPSLTETESRTSMRSIKTRIGVPETQVRLAEGIHG